MLTQQGDGFIIYRWKTADTPSLRYVENLSNIINMYEYIMGTT